MAFLDGLLGRKRDKSFDWLELNGPIPQSWDRMGEDPDGLEYSIDRSSCFKDGDIVWWKQRIGIPGDKYDYLICGASISTRGVMIPICRTLSDPKQELIKPDVLKQMVRADKSTPFGECLDKAVIWAEYYGYASIPPYVLYAMSIVQDDR